MCAILQHTFLSTLLSYLAFLLLTFCTHVFCCIISVLPHPTNPLSVSHDFLVCVPSSNIHFSLLFFHILPLRCSPFFCSPPATAILSDILLGRSFYSSYFFSLVIFLAFLFFLDLCVSYTSSLLTTFSALPCLCLLDSTYLQGEQSPAPSSSNYLMLDSVLSCLSVFLAFPCVCKENHLQHLRRTI